MKVNVCMYITNFLRTIGMLYHIIYMCARKRARTGGGGVTSSLSLAERLICSDLVVGITDWLILGGRVSIFL